MFFFFPQHYKYTAVVQEVKPQTSLKPQMHTPESELKLHLNTSPSYLLNPLFVDIISILILFPSGPYGWL